MRRPARQRLTACARPAAPARSRRRARPPRTQPPWPTPARPVPPARIATAATSPRARRARWARPSSLLRPPARPQQRLSQAPRTQPSTSPAPAPRAWQPSRPLRRPLPTRRARSAPRAAPLRSRAAATWPQPVRACQHSLPLAAMWPSRPRRGSSAQRQTRARLWSCFSGARTAKRRVSRSRSLSHLKSQSPWAPVLPSARRASLPWRARQLWPPRTTTVPALSAQAATATATARAPTQSFPSRRASPLVAAAAPSSWPTRTTTSCASFPTRAPSSRPLLEASPSSRPTTAA